MKKSIWLENNRNFESLRSDISTDILIIGGGMSGTNTLYFLKDSNYNITLVNNTNYNTSCNSTAKITYLQQDIYEKIKKTVGLDKAKRYYKSQKDAINLITSIIKKENIDCDLTMAPSYLFTESKEKFDSTRKILKSLNINYQATSSIPIPINNIHSLKVDDTYLFNPYRYIYELKKKLIKQKHINIFDNTLIRKIEKKNNLYLAYTKDNIIKCKTIILACHYPFYVEKTFPFRTYLERSILSAIPCKSASPFSIINLDSNVLSLRSYKNQIIFLSNSHNINHVQNINKLLSNHLKTIFTYYNVKTNYTWINHDIMTNDHIPLAGKIKHENIYLLTGYNTWGMTNSTICAKLISDLVLKNKSLYTSLFSLYRNTNIKKLGTDIIYSFSSGATLLSNKINKEKTYYPESVYIKKEHNKTYGIYIDNKGIKHIVSNLCPHMKCNLFFNCYDKTWDCPCHGSRFDIDGNVIKGPSTFSIKIKEKKDL